MLLRDKLCSLEVKAPRADVNIKVVCRCVFMWHKTICDCANMVCDSRRSHCTNKSSDLSLVYKTAQLKWTVASAVVLD